MFKKFAVLKIIVMSAIVFTATFIAHTSANACMFWYYYQPEMPKSLIKQD